MTTELNRLGAPESEKERVDDPSLAQVFEDHLQEAIEKFAHTEEVSLLNKDGELDGSHV